MRALRLSGILGKAVIRTLWRGAFGGIAKAVGERGVLPLSGNGAGDYRETRQATVGKRGSRVSGNGAVLSRQLGETKGCSQNQLFVINQVLTLVTRMRLLEIWGK